MATLQLINNTGADVNLTDVGIIIPPSGDTFTDPETLRLIVQSNQLRNHLTAGNLTANDGIINLPTAEALVYLSILWQRGGRDDVAGIRFVASGTTLIAANTTVNLATVTKFPTERLSLFLFVTDDVAGCSFGEGLASVAGDAVRGFFERANVANQCIARAHNTNVAASRTIQWAVVGMRV